MQKNKKLIVTIILMSIIMIFCNACKSTEQAPDSELDENNVLSGNYYLGIPSDAYNVFVYRFNEDLTVERVDCGLGRSQDHRSLDYGIYEIEGAKLTLNISGEDEIVCVIHDEGKSITIDGEEYSLTDPTNLMQETLDAFD